MNSVTVGPRKPRGIRAKHRARTREQILRAGLKIFAEKGFHGATMDEIALELEATKGLLYYHFRTKDQILDAILAENDLVSRIEGDLMIPEGVPLAEGLRRAVSGATAVMERNAELIRFLHVQAFLSGTQADRVYTRVLDRAYGRATRWIEHFKRTGEVRADVNARAWGQLVVDLLINHFLQDLIFGRHREAQQIDPMLDILLKGIASREGRARELGAVPAANRSDPSN
ncbi:MAG: TetR/AcrR family transcriptional regulator [Candidatus Binataceae bacterium]